MEGDSNGGGDTGGMRDVQVGGFSAERMDVMEEWKRAFHNKQTNFTSVAIWLRLTTAGAHANQGNLWK